MISVYELRVGNRFNATPCSVFPEGGEIALELSHIQRFAEDGQDITQYLSGIPVTNDWLTKAGFVLSTKAVGSIDFFIAVRNHFVLVRNSNRSPWRLATEHFYTRLGGGSQDMVYVHQVQDAYCSVLGQPLLPGP